MDLSYRLLQRKARIRLWQCRAKGNLKIHRGQLAVVVIIRIQGGFLDVTKDRRMVRMVRVKVLYCTMHLLL